MPILAQMSSKVGVVDKLPPRLDGCSLESERRLDFGVRWESLLIEASKSAACPGRGGFGDVRMRCRVGKSGVAR